MTDEERAALDAAIRQHYGTPHRFCKQTGLPRGTIYQVLAGRYAGDMDRQGERIRQALRHPRPAGLDAASIGRVLRQHACSRCLSRGSGLCDRCEPVFAAQTQDILALAGQSTEEPDGNADR